MKNRGSILFSVLWMILFFSAAVGVLGARIGSKIFMVQKVTEKSALRIASYSGVGYMQQMVRHHYGQQSAEDAAKPFSENWFGDSAFHEPIAIDENQSFVLRHRVKGLSDDSAILVAGLEDETGRVNLNRVSQYVLEQIYLFGGGLSSDDAVELAKKTIEYRDRKSAFSKRTRTTSAKSQNARFYYQRRMQRCKNCTDRRTCCPAEPRTCI